jgi:hypothetical protein
MVGELEQLTNGRSDGMLATKQGKGSLADLRQVRVLCRIAKKFGGCRGLFNATRRVMYRSKVCDCPGRDGLELNRTPGVIERLVRIAVRERNT